MEDDQKKMVKVGIIVGCLVVAGVIMVSQLGSDEVKIPDFEGETIWVLCRNPACGTNYQMSKNAYFVYLKENDDPRVPVPPGLICEKCGEKSGYRAEKCPKCGEVYESGAIFGVHGDVDDYPDRCPKCRYSKQEEKRGVPYKPK
jgi:hypothetical protein